MISAQTAVTLLRCLLTGFLVVAAADQVAAATNYPTRPVTLVVPFAPGGGTEFLARMLGQRLERAARQAVRDREPAGRGRRDRRSSPSRARRRMAHAADGAEPGRWRSTSPCTRSCLTTRPTDFVPLALVVISPYVLVVNPSLPVQSVARPHQARQANARANSPSRPTGPARRTISSTELLKSMTGIEMTHVPIAAAIPALTDVAGGHVQLMFCDCPAGAAA